MTTTKERTYGLRYRFKGSKRLNIMPWNGDATDERLHEVMTGLNETFKPGGINHDASDGELVSIDMAVVVQHGAGIVAVYPLS